MLPFSASFERARGSVGTAGDWWSGAGHGGVLLDGSFVANT